MAEPLVTLLRYRPWRGELSSPIWASWAMARMSFKLLVRRKIFWGLFSLAAMIFFFFFYGQYLVVWITQQTANQTVLFGGLPVKVAELTKFLDRLNLNGSAYTYANFIWFEGFIVTIILALAGSVLVGNDFHHNSLPFYLSKPIGRRHYILGKCLAIGLVINLLTTLPAILLYLQAGLLYDWQVYYVDHARQFFGILAYGLILTVSLSLLLVATSVWVRRTVPLVMVWMGLFVLSRAIANWLVDGVKLDERFRLFDLWNDLYLVGLWCLDADFALLRPTTQPQVWEAATAVAAVGALCCLYLRKRIQAVEIIG